ncbi:MAG TPA: CHAT domain-containing protein [Nostocaceae cyanobacterium]|nr:CHAT domain-containing protein [Nostocaceae cyanobacterium]
MSIRVLAQAPTPTAEEQIIEAVRLNSQAESTIYQELVSLDNLQAGLKVFQQTLEIFKKYNVTAAEAKTLMNIGYIYLRQGEYSQALKLFQSSADIYKKNRDIENEWIPLSYLGETYVNLTDYPQALEAYQSALKILRQFQANNPKAYSSSEKIMLADMGAIYFRLGQYQKALEFYQQSLAIQKANDDYIGSSQTMNNIGVAYLNLGNYAQALDAYQQALNPVQDLCYKQKSVCYYGLEAAILNNFAGVYFNLGQYSKALESAEKAANIYQKLESGEYKGTSNKDIELIYAALGENPQALQQVASRANVGDAFGQDSFQERGKALNFNNIGQIYFGLGKYDQAVKLYQQALKIYQTNKYPQGIGVTLNYIARVDQNQGNFNQAIALNEQALVNYRSIGDRTGEGVTISNLGQSYQKQNQTAKATELYQQALAIHREVGDKVSEAATLKFLGDVLAVQNQPQLAIAFYKQSVNLTETIRQNLRTVSSNIQQTYTETVAERYRKLADLLLQQNRPAEAQEVLDLLKIQEVTDFIGSRGTTSPKVENNNNNNQRGGTTFASPEIAKLPLKTQEQEITKKYSAIQDKAITLGKELTNLRQIPPKQRNSNQEKRITELVKLEQEVAGEFNKFTKNPDVVSLVQQLSNTSGQENLNLRQLNSIRSNLRQLNRKAVLLYPLVLDDRLEIVIVTADSPPIHRPVKVTKAELEQTVIEYRRAIQNPAKNIKEPANKLYNWLIKPIENDLKQADAEAIVYAPDGKLRYVPLAALYDGQKWLVERFIINNITAASLTKLDSKPLKSLPTLAAAFTKGDYTVSLGQRQASFSGLEFAKAEVENLAKTLPETKVLLDQDFSPQITIPQMNDYKIVHLATHGMLDKDNPESSFILFGNGERATLKDIENWSLPNVDLVVLSACQTALGEKLGNGQEILGLGYQIQLTGAKATIASLWTVSDGGTQALMNRFYKILQKGNVTKAEALQQAQLELLTNNQATEFKHPYYWSAFILIGNGL